MKSCIVSFLLLGCLVSSSYSKLPGLMNPGAGADLKAKSTTMESGIWSDDDIKSGKSFKDQEKHLIKIATKGGCDCSANEGRMKSLHAQLDLYNDKLNDKLPGRFGKQVYISLQNIKLALKAGLLPVNVAFGGIPFMMLDKMVPTGDGDGSDVKDRLEDILNLADPGDVCSYFVGESLKWIGGEKFEEYEQKMEMPTSATDCKTICEVDDSPAINSLKQILANQEKFKPEVVLALHSLKIALKIGFFTINGATGGAVYGVLDGCIPTEETVVEKLLDASTPKKAMGLVVQALTSVQKYAKEPERLKELYGQWFT